MNQSSNSPEASDELEYYDDDYLFVVDEGWQICPVCDGLGCDNWDDQKICMKCMGEGELPVM